jgi:hypothetical protein
MKGEAETTRYGPPRREVLWFLELVAVFGLACAQPIFDLLGKNPLLFVAWNATPARTLGAVAVVVLGPPLVVYAVELTAALAGPRVRRVAHAVLVGVGIGLVAMEAAKQATELDVPTLVAIGVVAGALGGLARARFPGVRTWLRVLAVAPVAFAVLLLVGPASVVVFGSDPGAVDVRVAHPHRVVMIVMDEFPLTSLLDGKGAIDARLFPNFAALSRQGTWYRNATTVAPFTEAAVPALLTGSLPVDPDTVPVVAEYPHNLFRLLGGTYALNVHEAVTRLCPTSECAPRRRPTGVGTGFRGMLEDVATTWWDFADPGNRTQVSFGGLGGEDTSAWSTAEGFLGTLGPSDGPELDYLHVLLPHFPWHYLPTGQDYAALPGHTTGLHGQIWANDDVAALMRVRHLLQVQAADTFVGRLVARLKELGVYDDTLLVVTADHGVAFEGGEPIRGFTRATVPDIAWVPLFVKAPNQQSGGRDDREAESIDVLPTMAEHLGVRIPWRVDGRSLLGPRRHARTFPMLDWSRSLWHPPPGTRYLHVARAPAFRAVLAARAAAPREQADLPVFAIGPYADLIGRRVPAAVGAPSPRGRVVLDGPLRYLLVNQASAKTPFVAIHGTIGLRAGTHLAVVVNGVVAGFSTVYLQPGASTSEFWGTLVPSTFHNGRNLVQVYAVDGDPAAPRLHLVRS